MRASSPRFKNGPPKYLIFSGICDRCKKIFWADQNNSFCSYKCGSIRGHEIKCASCKNKMWKMISRDRKRFCSKKCFGKSIQGPASPNWKGGIRTDGYRNIRVGDKLILEHRHVMSQSIGRPLKKFEFIHHKNGIRNDNRIENLELCVVRQPYGQRIKDLISFIGTNYKIEILNFIKTKC